LQAASATDLVVPAVQELALAHGQQRADLITATKTLPTTQTPWSARMDKRSTLGNTCATRSCLPCPEQDEWRFGVLRRWYRSPDAWYAWVRYGDHSDVLWVNVDSIRPTTWPPVRSKRGKRRR
jgi:hypothetical protein